MINIKYYLILLICVFLSLGLGMVIGISLQSKDVLEKQHNIIAERLEKEFLYIRNENRQLKESVNLLEKQEKEYMRSYEPIFNAIIKNKLHGLNICLVEMGEENIFPDIEGVLSATGARVGSNIFFDGKLFNSKENLDDTINVASPVKMDGELLQNQLSANLMDSISLGKYTALMEYLSDLGLIRSSGDPQNTCDAVILVYNATEQTKIGISKFTSNLAKSSAKCHIPIIVVEDEKTKPLDSNWYKKMGVSTVSHMNTIYGKLALVSLLYGHQGNYGYAGAKDGLFPEELFPRKNETGYINGEDGEIKDIDEDCDKAQLE